MSKNPIQFQQGFSLGEFMDEYGTEEKCRKALFTLRWPEGFACPSCKNSTYCQADPSQTIAMQQVQP